MGRRHALTLLISWRPESGWKNPSVSRHARSPRYAAGGISTSLRRSSPAPNNPSVIAGAKPLITKTWARSIGGISGWMSDSPRKPRYRNEQAQVDRLGWRYILIAWLSARCFVFIAQPRHKHDKPCNRICRTTYTYEHDHMSSIASKLFNTGQELSSC